MTHSAAARTVHPTSAKSAAPAASSASPLAVANASAVPVAVPAASSTLAPAAPDPAPAAPAADPGFDPDKGYVEVGLINAQGVSTSTVRGALHGVALGQCYRTALKARGTRASGVAMLDLSIDENGGIRSAIVTGADFLPGVVRCIQGGMSGVHIAKSQVDSNGAAAEVTLAFKVP